MTVHKRVLARTALLTAASASAWLGFAGLARAADPAAPPTAQGGEAGAGQLEEVVITATHFTTEANQTPLSVSTVTVNQLNQQGINTFANLVGQVPSVQISAASVSGALATVDIRGVIQSNGAATTGFYLDDTPLQSYNNAGAVINGNGTPLPPIFDLQRVEVLEGPQGTLFGASSEGGTIRYITPEPSLQNWEVYSKLDGSQTQHANGVNYNAGLAVGGPLIPGELGFRASVATTHQGGWIQMEDPNTQQIIGTGMNSSTTDEFHGALLWKPTDQLSVKASLWLSDFSAPYLSTSYNISEPYPIVEPELGFNTTGITAAAPTANPKPVCIGTTACAAYKGTITYLRPGATAGPFSLPAFTTLGEVQQDAAPAYQSIEIPSVDATWNFPRFTAQLFSSYLRQLDRQTSPNGNLISANVIQDITVGSNSVPTGLTFLPGNPDTGYEIVVGRNERNMWTEDLRLSSAQGPTQLGKGLLSWTAGLYYQDEWDYVAYAGLFPPGGLENLSAYYYGLTPSQRFGANALPYSGNIGPQPYLTEVYTAYTQRLSNTDAALYAEGSYNITDHLQATVGLRESFLSFSFWAIHYGPANNPYPVPTFQNGGAAEGASTETAFTPKGELTYRFSPNKLVYALVDKGFRPGGANPPIAATGCSSGAAFYGLTVTQFPTTYGPDSDWNYELGTKLGFDEGRVQVNADVYRLLWSNVQTSQSPPGCGTAFTSNAAHATSAGAELSVQAIATKGLLLNASFGYDHAYYSENALAVPQVAGFPAFLVAITGQNFNITPWTSSVGARLDFSSAFGVGGSYHPYVRADWTLLGGHNASVYGLSGYDPYTAHVPSIPLLNARAGMDIGPFSVNIYALNATGSLAGVRSGGPSGCTNPACTAYTIYQPLLGVTPANPPRSIGVQFTYVH